MQLGDCLSSAHGGSIESLIDRYLGPLYPDYADHTRPMLIRQARDLLVCTFHGDLERFEGDFLRPATDIVRELRCAYQRGKNDGEIGHNSAATPLGWYFTPKLVHIETSIRSKSYAA
uniref:Uncharacterized protein n=1 Tax=Anopheles maculatus TaxID=74869 RepID=A0A182T8T5_9DIPT